MQHQEDPLVPTDTEFEQRKTEKTLAKRYLLNSPPSGVKIDVLARHRHISWLTEKLTQPSSSSHLDSSRPWLVYWPLHALDLMRGANQKILFNQPLPSQNNNNSATNLGEALFEWIFRCFTYVDEHSNEKHPIYPSCDNDNNNAIPKKLSTMGGFSGGWRQAPHLASCWAACASLIILCDEIPKLRPKLKDRLDRPALTKWLASLRTKDGGFRMFTRGEVDLRATYCAACIATVFDLNAEEIFPLECLEFIGRCQSLDGGISSNIHGSEGHGGYVSCGFLALLLMHCLRENQTRRKNEKQQQQENETSATPSLSSSLLFDKYYLDTRQLRRWCALRQDPCVGAFSGRVNKLVDSCYSWWVGGSMSALALVDAVEDISSSPSSSNEQELPASALQVMKIRSLSLIQNALLFTENKTKKILKEVQELGQQQQQTSNDVQDHDQEEIPPTSSTTAAATAAGGWEDESFDDGGDFAYNQDRLAEYVLELAQTRMGGLCDKPDLNSDLYHTCYSLSGLAVSVSRNDKVNYSSEKSEIVYELENCLRNSKEGEEEEEESVDFIIEKLFEEAYQFQHFEAAESLKSTPFQTTHPLLNLTRKRVKFALEFFGGRDSLL